MECSSLNGDNVNEVFSAVARCIVSNIESGSIDPSQTGSGVQYGDSALKRLELDQRTQEGSSRQCCNY